MAIATGTAMLIAAGATAAAQAYSAKKGSDAASDAAGMQSDAAGSASDAIGRATREALGFQRDVYNQGRADQQPWIQAGQGSVNKLAHLMGIEMGGGFAPLQGSGGGRAATLPQGAGVFPGASRPTPSLNGGGSRGTYRWPGAEPTMEELAEYRGDMREERQYARQNRPGFVPRRPQSPSVNMQAPDGSVQAVPAEMVEHYMALGAKVV